MKIFFAVLSGVAVMAATAWGDDMKTLSGQTYSNIVVQQHDQQGYTILHDGGTTNVPFKDIRPELRGHYKSLAVIPIGRGRSRATNEEPLGPNDIQTLSGQTYRNIVVKKIEEKTFLIAHDTGMDTVYFATIPMAMQEKIRKGPVVADPPAGPNDILTTYGLIFRNTEILRTEPNGVTFRHDGGVTKLPFPALPPEMGEKYEFEPMAAWKYGREVEARQRAMLEVPDTEEPNGEKTFEVYAIETETLEDDKFWVRFSVKNISYGALSVKAVPTQEQMVPIAARKVLAVKAQSAKELQQFVVPGVAPTYLRVYTDTYRTNCLLTWEAAEETGQE